MKMHEGAWSIMVVVVAVLLIFVTGGCADSSGDADADRNTGQPTTASGAAQEASADRNAGQSAAAGGEKQEASLSGVWELYGVTEQERWLNDRIRIYSPDAEMETGENRVALNFPGRFNETYEWDVPARVLRPGDPLPGLRIRSEVYDGAPGQADGGIRADIRVMERRTMKAAYSAVVSMPRPGPGVFEDEGAAYTSGLAGQEGQVLSAVPQGASNQTLSIDFMAAHANAFRVVYRYGWVD